MIFGKFAVAHFDICIYISNMFYYSIARLDFLNLKKVIMLIFL